MKRISLVAAVLATIVSILGAAQQRSPEIDTLLRTAVDQRRVPLVVAMVADSRSIVYEQAVGADKDAIFAIASMTKPVTSVAVMQFIEAGRVKLDEPAATYVPELAAARVRDGETLRSPKTPITVRHLLTHTSGLGYEFLNKDLFELVAKKELPSLMAGGDGFLKAPLLFDPGTRWEYGISSDWLGRLVEHVSGQSLEAYFRQEIFDPLGMPDTFFNVPAGKRSRIVATFARAQDGSLAAQPRPPATVVEFFSGGVGLFSTAADYMKLVRALMAGGRLGERRILSPESVAMMGMNQIGELTLRRMPSMLPQFAADMAVLPGDVEKFGFGFALNLKSDRSRRGANTMAWAGIYNTFFWIDREKQVGAVLMSQMLPYLDPGATKLLDDFEAAVYASRL
jgi:methyl acetate hydrolase